MGNDRSRCLDLRPSCAAIATRESLRIIRSDALPAHHRRTRAGKAPRALPVLCPSSSGTERGGRKGNSI